MNIAQVCHLQESVPPKYYGGTERVVSFLTEELVRRGHNVTLFATGDSATSARLEAVWPAGTRLFPGAFTREAATTLLLEKVFGFAEQYDVIHSHLDFLAFPMIRRCPVPVVTTVHGRMDLPELQRVYGEFKECALVSISHSQRRQSSTSHWVANVYHGLPSEQFAFSRNPGRYLAFIGRLSPEKGPDQAIAIAKRVGIPLRMAAKSDTADAEYIERIIQPLLNEPLVDFVGEINDVDKQAFFGNAVGLLCPYSPEPFGLTLIEALACGTPVITYNHGSFPEIIEHGLTGFLCRDTFEMESAVTQLETICRQDCRAAFEKHFTVQTMTDHYIEVYDHVLQDAKGSAHHSLVGRRHLGLH